MGGLSAVRTRCPAKLNLFLEVHRRREDGFHELTTVFQTLAFGDDLVVELDPTAAAGSVACDVASDPDRPELAFAADGVPSDDGNLAVRAARALLADAGRDDALRIAITKRIPPAGGLGGGSSDAAGVLRAVDRLLELETPSARLREIALDLGSDVPFLLDGGTAVARGRGELLTHVSALPEHPAVLFVPDLALATPAVYGALTPDDFGERGGATHLAALRTPEPGAKGFEGHNALWAPAVRVAPALGALRDRLAAELSVDVHLTGSGSTLYALAPHGVCDRLASRDGIRAVVPTRLAPGAGVDDVAP